MVLTTLARGLFAYVHDHFLRTHKFLWLCGAHAPARSHRDARRRRRTRRSRGRVGRLGRRLGRRWWRRIWRRGKWGFEDFPCPDPGLHSAHGARCDWPLASHRPAWGSARTGRCYWRDAARTASACEASIHISHRPDADSCSAHRAVRAAPAELGGPQAAHAAQHASDAPAWPPHGIFNL